MKKIFMILFFIINSSIAFTYTYEDYDIFIQGKNAYRNGNYEEAQSKFETLLKSYSFSPILKNNYAFYFIGMTYYKMGEWKNAVYYLEKAVFSHKLSFFNRGSEIEKNIYFAERDYSLGDALIKMGNKETGLLYLKRLDYSTFSPITSHFEEKALELLAKEDIHYQNYYNLKYKNDFSHVGEIPTSELLKAAHFFLSKKEYEKAKKLYKIILKTPNITVQDKEKAESELFRTLIISGKNKEIIALADEYGKNGNKDLYFFYKGLAYYRLKDFSRCLYAFENVKGNRYASLALFYITGIYYSFCDYEKVLKTAAKIPNKNIITEIMIANSYLKLGNNKLFEKKAESIIKKYPNSYEGMFYSFLLKNKDIDINKHNSVFKIGLILDNLLVNCKNIDENFISTVDKIEIEKISAIASMKDEELIKIEIENSSFINKYSIQNGYAITTILEKGEFFDLAYKNSSTYRKSFFEYKDLIKYNYPLYYKNIVDINSKKYDVPQELIYSAMLISSKFNKRLLSENSKIGLMQIPYESSKDIISLFDPQINIAIGTEKLKSLLESYKGNKLKSLIAYIYGEELLNRIQFDYDGDLNLDLITDPEERYELQNLILTYMFYKKLYNF
ncbi:transglycosylase SLT domain-containing protein [Fusobacterium varium]|uniref:transglycosylase SLT domain-containing protein n=1 Tax=Fusobacterium varium TaxID=856 RepID=UPI002432383A|nr:transglycosylase SLT domain-containing protein [Fusobacterium varium]MCI6034143.1 transglycosylase SLT domain-containing protein [Fusobacterium varium]